MITNSPEETTGIGFNLGITLKRSAQLICLYGDLGGGKTTFVKGVAQALGITQKTVKSPTFVLMHQYRAEDVLLVHVDCYRIQDPVELLSELSDFFDQEKTWVIIEWAERLKDFLPVDRVEVYFEHVNENQRNIIVKNPYGAENTK
ncbi:MAG: hypothetical protein UY05_C0022G0009 [Candidatus Peregrinibacteria bacterium GW2011_GWA2_47_7]|nr:MAG: hypothetical protein UY05_C0022G0009 [Candidatus Peregrinibacteria bacterium GW2011_GWA2_47_7]